jgi:hypothetical protein
MPANLLSEYFNQQIAYAIAVCEANKTSLNQMGFYLQTFKIPASTSSASVSPGPEE